MQLEFMSMPELSARSEGTQRNCLRERFFIVGPTTLEKGEGIDMVLPTFLSFDSVNTTQILIASLC